MVCRDVSFVLEARMSLTVDEVSEDVSEGSVRMVDIGAIVALVELDGLSSSVIIWFTLVAWPKPIVEKRGQEG